MAELLYRAVSLIHETEVAFEEVTAQLPLLVSVVVVEHLSEALRAMTELASLDDHLHVLDQRHAVDHRSVDQTLAFIHGNRQLKDSPVLLLIFIRLLEPRHDCYLLEGRDHIVKKILLIN